MCILKLNQRVLADLKRVILSVWFLHGAHLKCGIQYLIYKKIKQSYQMYVFMKCWWDMFSDSWLLRQKSDLRPWHLAYSESFSVSWNISFLLSFCLLLDYFITFFFSASSNWIFTRAQNRLSSSSTLSCLLRSPVWVWWPDLRLSNSCENKPILFLHLDVAHVRHATSNSFIWEPKLNECSFYL